MRCRTMFSRINSLAWHRKCQPKAKMDFLRQVPCPANELCSEEDDKSRVQPGSQFTFTVQDRRQPRFWYLSLIACYRNMTTCEWETSALPHPGAVGPPINKEGNSTEVTPVADLLGGQQFVPAQMKYDIWMVNGVPRLRDYYRFEHQFSFEYHDIFEINLTFGVLYLFLGIILHIKYKGEYEPLACLLFTHIWLYVAAATLHAIHLAAYAFDGKGACALLYIGNVLGCASETVLLILILTTADVGFPILPAELSHFEEKVRRYRKRQFMRINSAGVVQSSASGFSNNRTLGETDSAQNSHRRLKEILLPAYAATWSAAVARSEVIKAATMVPTSSVVSLAFANQEEESTPACCGLIKCTQRRKRTCVYLGCMMSAILSIELGLYIWALFDQDPVLDISVWNTTPGRLLVAVRMVLAFWFLSILYRRQSSSNLSEVIEPLHFAVAYLIWFLSLPAVVFVAHTSVSPLWRQKTIFGVMHLSDFLASILYAQLINRANSYASH
uniref:GpcrRhopsn4 domain-containing protein n=1 Tax=Mesocestoides corti TaxID=53468 RepID=A0A5K3FFD7_MESCO